jgi:hypothetical protein
LQRGYFLFGGEKAVCRIVRFPRMSEKELWSAVKLEVQKYVPTPAGQLVISASGWVRRLKASAAS